MTQPDVMPDRVLPGQDHAVPANTVHVWLLDLDRLSTAAEEPWFGLSPRELERACRFRDQVQASRWRAYRAGRRHLLSRYLGVDPTRIDTVHSPTGRPRVRSDAGAAVDFSCSVSGSVAVIAVSSLLRVGIDVEQVRPLGIRIEKASHLVFSPEVCQRLRRLRGDEQQAAFLREWVLLEARVKCTGEGLLGRQLQRSNDCHEAIVLEDRPGIVSALAWMPREAEHDGDASQDARTAPTIQVQEFSWHLASPF